MNDGHLLLVRRICTTLKRPVFEVMSWPTTELEYWSLFFHLEDNPPTKAEIEKQNRDNVKKQSTKEARSKFRSLFGSKKGNING